MSTVAARDRLIELLKARGVELKVGGCGCCGSPFVTATVDGEVIVDGDEMNIPPSNYERKQEEAQKLYPNDKDKQFEHLYGIQPGDLTGLPEQEGEDK